MTEAERLEAIAGKLNGIANAMASCLVVTGRELAYWRIAVEEAYDLARSAPQDRTGK